MAEDTPIQIVKLKEIAKGVFVSLQAELQKLQPINHSTTKGGGSEHVWIKLFENYLPKRYRIASGIVVDSTGATSDQIDCLIFDGQFTPQIIPNDGILHIPTEAVYAVFEVKQNINKEHLEYAAKKVRSVRCLKRTSSSYTGDGQNRSKKPLFNILGGLLAGKIDWQDSWKSDSFKSSLQEAQQISHLDFVFSAKDGYADMVRTKNQSMHRDININGDPIILEGKQGILHGLFRLLEELTRQGTVPAVDWSEYYSKLGSTYKINI